MLIRGCWVLLIVLLSIGYYLRYYGCVSCFCVTFMCYDVAFGVVACGRDLGFDLVVVIRYVLGVDYYSS